MKHTYLFIGVLGLALLGCEKKETDREMHFGPSPGDGETEQTNEMHFGPSPGDGLMKDEAEESLHFGTSSGDG